MNPAEAPKASAGKTASLSPTIATAALLALIALCLAWELWLAPLRPGGSWLVLKVLPLLVPLRGFLHGRRYTYKWATLFVFIYFTEGVVRAVSEQDVSRQLALIEIALSVVLFVAAILYVRATRQPAVAASSS